ncbi:iron-containing alcohol dehydrogenase [Ascidiaceihabitans sp.]|uniref:iron-containing alcohol dehydrogenase n=1 Tax=Ascidiaceihabitans sp. TaxID=1872644 RepID=UPI003297204F
MTSAPFSFACSTKVHFGVGTHRDILDCLPQNAAHVVVVKGASDGASAPLRAILDTGDFTVDIVTCRAEPTLETVNDALGQLGSQPVDCVVVCGGGSAIDTGKALTLALDRGCALSDADFGQSHAHGRAITLIVLPTTAGTGAEVTSNAVLGSAQTTAKVSLRGPALQPDIAIVDPSLMPSAPRKVALFSGLDAVVQNIEAHTSSAATPFSCALTTPAVGASIAAVRQVMEAPDEDAWTRLAWGSLSSGLALANGGLGVAHGLASVLGGAYQAPHGALCGRLLAPTLRANLASDDASSDTQGRIRFCIDAIAQVFAPVDVSDPLSGFEQWVQIQGLPRLAHWGVLANDIPALAQAGVQASSSKKNAVPLGPADLAHILEAAL